MNSRLRILLLDLNPATPIRRILETIMKSSRRPAVELIEASAGVDETLYFPVLRELILCCGDGIMRIVCPLLYRIPSPI